MKLQQQSEKGVRAVAAMNHGISRIHRLRGRLLCCLALVLPWCVGCGASKTQNDDVADANLSINTSTQLPSAKLFTEANESAGISFVHTDGPVDCYEIPRAIGSGGGWIDANGDQRLDILIVDGGREVKPNNEGTLAVLYLQTAEGTFEDFSSEAGFRGTGYGMGVAVGDIDNDGDEDVYLTKYGPDQLFLNDGTGRFTDVTREAGIENLYWSTAVAMTDLNRDGWLDLVVGNYVDYYPGTFCGDASGRPEFGGPTDFPGTPNRVYMNLQCSPDGIVRFEDRSATSGLASLPGKTLGLICRDFNGDGRVDIFVANDAEANHLWMQNSDESFTEEALLRGVAVNRFGEPEGNMGTVMGDFTADHLPDLIVTHLSGEMNTLWQGDANGFFSDETSRFRFGPAGLAQTGFGIVGTDVDFNGGLDILVANGRVNRDPHRAASPVWFWDQYAERNQIFLADAGDFREVDDGAFTQSAEVWRALATGDYDRDGDQDLLLTSIGRPARLYRNDAKKHGHWLSVRPLDPVRKRVACGAIVTVVCEDSSRSAEVLPHTSFLSSHEPVAHFGLGNTTQIQGVDIIWPDDPMFIETFSVSHVDQHVELIRGSGKGVRPRPAGDVR